MPARNANDIVVPEAERAAPLSTAIVVDDSGLARCFWSERDDEYRRYHDQEWGTELRGDRPLFEKLSLEGFQAGLSWITILRKRTSFRRAFAGFDIDTVASMTEPDVAALMLDAGIIRNRAKIEATISNARITRDLIDGNDGALDRLLWSFAPRRARDRPMGPADVPSVTEESTAMSRALRKLGYRFVGPTTLYALMQSSGMVDDHFAGCWRASSG